MRDHSYQRIAVITPATDDRETEQHILSMRGITANPIIKVENGESKFAYMFPIENTTEGQNQLVDLARTLKGYDVIVSTEDRSSFKVNVTDWHNSIKHIGCLTGARKYTAQEHSKDLYLYDPKKEAYYVFG